MLFTSLQSSFLTEKMPLVCVVFISLVALTARTAIAAPSDNAKPNGKVKTAQQKPLLAANSAQVSLLTELEKKAGRKLKLLRLASGSLFDGMSGRLSTQSAAVPISPEYVPAFYGAMGDSLLMAQSLLRTGDVTQQRRGLRLALISTRWCFPVPENTKMVGRIYDGWIMPYINAARPESWKDIGRAELLKSASRAYYVTGEKTKRARALRLLLASDVNANTRDQTRVQLAEVLADLERYDEAMTLVQKIETPEMQGTKTWIKELKQKQAAQNAAPKPKQ